MGFENRNFMKKIKVTLVKSPIDRPERQKLTLQALEAYRTQACTWNWIPCTVSEPFLSLTVSLASGIKFIALAVVLLTSLCYLAIGIRQRLQRLTRPLN